MSRPNERILRLSILLEATAKSVSEALDHIRLEMVHCDSYPTSVPMAGPPPRLGLPPAYDEDDRCQHVHDDGMTCWNARPCMDHEASPALTAVERAAHTRWQLQANRAQIFDDLNALEELTNSLLKVARYTQGIRGPSTEKPRCDTRHLDGYLLARDDGGWSDPTCRDVPRSGQKGPCDACYKRHTRWRRLNGKKPLDSEIPAA